MKLNTRWRILCEIVWKRNGIRFWRN